MNLETAYKNGALESTKKSLSNNPEAMKLAAKVFKNTKGSIEKRLSIALDVAIESLKDDVELILLPDNLEDKTCAWLRAFAKEHNISYYSSDNKAKLISHIRFEASNRKFFS